MAKELDPESVCGVVGNSAVDGAFSADLKLVEELSGPYSCVFETDDGLKRVSVRIHDVADRAALDALLADVAASAGDDVEVNDVSPVPNGSDEALRLVSSAEGTYSIVVRKAGSAAVIQATGFGDDRVGERTIELAEWIAPGLPDSAFDGTGPATLPCDALDRAVLAEALGTNADGLRVTPVPGVTACSITAEADSLTVQVYEPLPAMTAEQFAGLGRRRVVDGKEYTTTPEAVDGVGSLAAWVAEPQEGSSGDLYSNWGSSTLRVTVSDPTATSAQLREVGAAVAPPLAAAFVRE